MTDNHLKQIAQLTKLIRDYDHITDDGLAHIKWVNAFSNLNNLDSSMAENEPYGGRISEHKKIFLLLFELAISRFPF